MPAITDLLQSISDSTGGGKDGGPLWTPSQQYTGITGTGSTALTGAPTSGQKIVADDLLLSSDTAMSFTLQDGSGGATLAKVYLPANVVVQITLRNGLRVPTANNALYGQASVAGNVAVTVSSHSA